MNERASKRMRFLRHASMLALLHCISFLSNSFAWEAVGCANPQTIWINGIYNSGFEWVADSTTKPAKYGAYWLGAFLYEEGNPADLIVEDAAFRENGSARYLWWYSKTEYWDETVGMMPVFRVMKPPQLKTAPWTP